MKKCQPLSRSQHKLKSNITFTNHTPKLNKKPISKFATYENLILSYIAENPYHTEYELSQACLYFATQCGLTVSQKAKEKMGGRNV